MFIAVGTDEATFDASLDGTVPHDRRVGAATDEQLDRFDEHGLAGARFARERGQAAAEDEIEPFDHAQVLDVEFGEHQRTFNHGGCDSHEHPFVRPVVDSFIQTVRLFVFNMSEW